jgi:large subunit ribosomal protein L19e
MLKIGEKMSTKTIRRIAADLLKCGESRVVFNPSEIKRVEDALTREDVRDLIATGAIIRLPKIGVSRGRARKRHLAKKKGRHRGRGTVRGKKFSRLPEKEAWMARIRAQRKLIKQLLGEGKIDGKGYRVTYRMVKGGAFKGRTQLLTHLKEAGMMKQ